MALTVRNVLCRTVQRLFSTSAASCSSNHMDETFYYKDLVIQPATESQLQPKPDFDNLIFGHHFSDHIFEVEWSLEEGWKKPKICPMHYLQLHPGAKVLHYAIELFEGMKAYRGVDSKIRIFRPDLNMKRMIRSSKRACLPAFNGEELIKCIEELVRLDQEWVPYSTTSTLYIRPCFIGTDPTLGVAHTNSSLLFVVAGPTGTYFPSGFKPISLFADPAIIRASPGGVGGYKMGSNYAPTILIGRQAQDLGCQQVLWLYGEDEKLTEVGTMNIFVFWINEDGEKELVTPPLGDGIILPGVTRQSLLDLAREWNEFKVVERYPTMSCLRKAVKENRLLEVFGSGTACIVCPVNHIMYKKGDEMEDIYIPTMEQNPCLMQRLFDTITDIQYGRIAMAGWTRTVVE